MIRYVILLFFMFETISIIAQHEISNKNRIQNKNKQEQSTSNLEINDIGLICNPPSFKIKKFKIN